MKRGLSLLLLLFLLGVTVVKAQNVSNKGKMFWVGHMGHIDGTGSNFALYITTDAPSAAAVRVSIPGTGYSQLVLVPSNQVAVHTLPSAQTYLNCTDCIQDKGVKIESLNHDIVVYAHIYSNARSDATLLIPVETLGKEYYTAAFTQAPSGATQRSEFMVIGVEDSTFVDIYPSTTILPSKPAGTMYTVMLNTGEVYHAQSAADMTGTRIVARSANGISCKSVAAFSGSSFTRVGCSNASTGDNLYQQLFPTTSWGMEFVTAPLKSRNGDQFRVLAMHDSTQVNINGSTQLIHRSQYYDFVSFSDNYISSNKPVTLIQYPRTQNCDGNTGDPTMIVIPPVEQSVKNVTMYSSPYQNITGQYLNIITKSTDTSKLRLDGNKIAFQTMTQNSAYAYARETVAAGNHRIQSDSFFQVVAYGFGTVEAYGYAGGTNIKNLVQSITTSKDSMCFGDTVALRAEVNYIPSSLKWYFGDGTTDTVNYFPKHVYASSGAYVVSLVTKKDGLVDCGSTDSTVYRLRVHDYPTASFAVSGHCLQDTFRFSDLSQDNSNFSYLSKWNWTFGDSTTSILQNPGKYFYRLDTFKVKLKVWNNNLCADSIDGVHFVSPHPEIQFSKHDTCPGFPVSLADASTIVRGRVGAWSWLIDSSFSDTNSFTSFTTLTEGIHYIDYLVESDSGCKSLTRDSFTVYQKPTADFTVPNVCLNVPILPDDKSLLADFLSWDLQDTSYQGAPVNYTYKDTGAYRVKLIVSTLQGCKDSMEQTLEIYPIPPSTWQTSGTCDYDDFVFEANFDTSLYPGVQYLWTIQGQSYSGAYQNLSFSLPGIKAAQLTSTSGFNCQSSTSGSTYVSPKPTAAIVQEPACEYQLSTVIDASNWRNSSSFVRTWTHNAGTSTDSLLSLRFDQGNLDWINLIIQTDSGCFDTTRYFPDYFRLPTAAYTIDGNCPDQDITFTSTSSPGVGSSLSEHNWLISQIAYTGAVQTDKYSNGGLYPVKLIVESDQGCLDSTNGTFRILDVPVPSVLKEEACIEFPVWLEDQSTMQYHRAVQWDWVWDGASYSGQRISESFIDSGWYKFSLSLTTDSGCVFTDIYQDSVEVYPGPYANFIADPLIVTLEKPVIRFSDRSLGSSYQVWDFGNGDTAIGPEQNYRYSDTGEYWVNLTVMNKYGCIAAVRKPVWIKPPLSCYVPNAFTPNEDLKNDGFFPVCEGVEEIRFKIWNRWGALVYETEEFKPWYPLDTQSGVFVYEVRVIDFAGDYKVFRGTVTLLK
ncbi:MAG: hypothetical protein EP332_13490 [Bacteroidetes bacterium]|nr:MAG: hypothetical protein EP332_13490 [Bacteroidota bacterium]